jgi:hypothetical protein
MRLVPGLCGRQFGFGPSLRVTVNFSAISAIWRDQLPETVDVSPHLHSQAQEIVVAALPLPALVC